MNKNQKGIILAILAAALYAISTPVSKLLLTELPPTLLAGFLYLGAGVGMGIVSLSFRVARSRANIQTKRESSEVPSYTEENAGQHRIESRLERGDLPYVLGMIALDVAAPILLLLGLRSATPENVSLLNNFEIVATSLIALLIFGEKISARLWWAIGLITLASGILSFESVRAMDFSLGSLLVILAACCWGLENNCTRKLSEKDPMQIVVVKGLCSGGMSLMIGLISGERIESFAIVLGALALGFVAYGLSIFTYVYAQRYIGAARTSAYYAVAPFIGAILSLIIFRQLPGVAFVIAAAVMAVGSYLAAKD